MSVDVTRECAMSAGSPGIGSLACPACGHGIRVTTNFRTFARIGRLSILIDRDDVARRHAACFMPSGGGERLAA